MALCVLIYSPTRKATKPATLVRQTAIQSRISVERIAPCRLRDGVVDEGEERDAGDTGDVGECTDDCRAVSGILHDALSVSGSLFCRDYRCVECLKGDCAADEVCRNGACVQRED